MKAHLFLNRQGGRLFIDAIPTSITVGTDIKTAEPAVAVVYEPVDLHLMMRIANASDNMRPPELYLDENDVTLLFRIRPPRKDFVHDLLGPSAPFFAKYVNEIWCISVAGRVESGILRFKQAFVQTRRCRVAIISEETYAGSNWSGGKSAWETILGWYGEKVPNIMED